MILAFAGDETIDVIQSNTSFVDCFSHNHGRDARLPETVTPDFVGHFDIVAKHCEKIPFFDIESKEYKNYALEALHALAPKCRFYEVNVGGIPRGYRLSPYPPKFILKEMRDLGCGLVITSDCHNKDYLNTGFDEAVELIRDCGFNEVYYLTKNGFIPEKLRSSVSVSLGAQFAVFPVSMSVFGMFAPAGIAAGLLLSFPVSFFLVSGFCCFLFSALFPCLYGLCGFFMTVQYKVIYGAALFFSGFPVLNSGQSILYAPASMCILYSVLILSGSFVLRALRLRRMMGVDFSGL